MQDHRIEDLLRMFAGNGMQDSEKTQQQAQAGLSPEQQAMFRKALTDKAFAQQLLQTPQAAQVIKKLQENGGKNGSQ